MSNASLPIFVRPEDAESNAVVAKRQLVKNATSLNYVDVEYV